MCSPGWPGLKLCSADVTLGVEGTQHGLATSSGWRGTYQSAVHSQTLPVMSKRPKPFGGKLPTGEVPSKPSSFVFCHGNSPCQLLAIALPSGKCSSPQAKTAASSPPRAACSHSASVGSSLPAQAAYASASSQATWTTGWLSRPLIEVPL